MSTTIPTAAKKLASALDRCRGKVKGLSNPALNAAAASSIALGQNDGAAYPAEYVRKRVGLVLTELEDLARVAGELDDNPKSGFGLLFRALKRRSFKHPGTARAVIDARLRVYCAARGSGTEWRRASSDSIRRAG
ncbi:MAG TPA: hypothetical protein VKF32_08595 [Thermoanaerobaculia bacterium]|nr:hypothetical protein [Thermoanaerobaculia bacterium]